MVRTRSQTAKARTGTNAARGAPRLQDLPPNMLRQISLLLEPRNAASFASTGRAAHDATRENVALATAFYREAYARLHEALTLGVAVARAMVTERPVPESLVQRLYYFDGQIRYAEVRFKVQDVATYSVRIDRSYRDRTKDDIRVTLRVMRKRPIRLGYSVNWWDTLPLYLAVSKRAVTGGIDGTVSRSRWCAFDQGMRSVVTSAFNAQAKRWQGDKSTLLCR